MNTKMSFYLNGELVHINNPPPDLLLIDYLRSPEVSLAGAKKGCGQGGCGACTVILSEWNPDKNSADHRSINSCLRPVCSLQGKAITTIEGTGGAKRLPPANLVHIRAPSRGGIPFEAEASEEIIAAQRLCSTERAEKIAAAGNVNTSHSCLGKTIDRSHLIDDASIDSNINPIAYRLAENNGSQCGYCSTGFVMNMSAYLANNPSPTKKQIEDAFDGNICRCTGYRSILTAMKTFAIDWSEEDEKKRMKCLLDDQVIAHKVGSKIVIPFPASARKTPLGVNIDGHQQQWLSPASVDELLDVYQNHPENDLYMLHANTSYGVYLNDFIKSRKLIDISQLTALYGISRDADCLNVGTGTTYTVLIDYLADIMSTEGLSETTAIGSLHFMARRTAGTIIRNAATLGGNSMLVLKHIHAGNGEPFPSDLFTVLAALNTKIEYVNLREGSYCEHSIDELIEFVKEDSDFAQHILLLTYHIPLYSENEFILSQKVAIRDINSHSLVNCTSILDVSDDLIVKQITLTFGAIAPYPWRTVKTEKHLSGKPLSLDGFSEAADLLRQEVMDELKHVRSLRPDLEYSGITPEYQAELAVSFVYKAIINTLVQLDESKVAPQLRSSGLITWGNWPVSDGVQSYQSKNQKFKAPVSQPYIKLMALYQTSGQVRYTHEMELPPTVVNAAFIQSQRALANYSFKNPDGGSHPVDVNELSDIVKRKFPALIKLVTCHDIPTGGLINQGMGADQPVFAEQMVQYIGQSIGLVIAKEEQQANRIAQFITEHCVHYETVEWKPEWQKPILGLDDAITRGSIFPDAPASASFITHIWKIKRNKSNTDWVTSDKAALDKSVSQRTVTIDGGTCEVVESTQTCGGQIHFYMETQSCIALPNESGRITFHPSSQSPMGMHQTAASVLGVEFNQLDVGIRQLGGGYGGKTEPAKFIIGACAIAANVMKRPVRLVMPRDNDTKMTGKRHPYYGQCQVAIDSGQSNSADRGIIRGMDYKFYGDGGAFYDCSFIVSNCLQTRVDNAYSVNNFCSTMDVYRTNTAPNTAFRSFGDIQGTLITENALDDAAFAIDMDPDDVREKNFYQAGDVTPYGQALTYCYIKEVWAHLKQVSDIEQRKKSVAEFNKNNKWKKRGIYMLPVKYGSGYNLVQLEQASAMVSVYSGDGSIIINQGGVDMGQGVITKIEQIAAYILNVPMDLIQVQFARTDVIPNPTSTGGSVGTAYNGLAVKQTCEKFRERITEFGYSVLKEQGDTWCHKNGIDFWNYKTDGWAAKASDAQAPKNLLLIWQNLINLAYTKRISLVETFNAKVPGGETGVPNIIYKPKEQQKAIPGINLSGNEIGGEFDSFCGFTYSAACSEVEVDILTGEVKIIRSDVMYDMGWSINPALDIGQVEGAFIQGVGYVTTEKLIFEPEGEDRGRLNTVNTWRYKPPATTNIPLEFNVHLFPRDKASNVPENPNELMSAKEVGEPPLVLACSVFFAIKAAIRASRVERGLNGLFQLDAPATVQEVAKACEVNFS